MHSSDVHDFPGSCDRCHKEDGISRKHNFPHTPILVIELFNVWSINFIGLFVMSNRNKYILVVIDYVSSWVKTVAHDDKSVTTTFLTKNIFSRFGTLRPLLAMKVLTFVVGYFMNYLRNIR